MFLLGDILDTTEETSHRRSYYVIHAERVEKRQTSASSLQCNQNHRKSSRWVGVIHSLAGSVDDPALSKRKTSIVSLFSGSLTVHLVANIF